MLSGQILLLFNRQLSSNSMYYIYIGHTCILWIQLSLDLLIFRLQHFWYLQQPTCGNYNKTGLVEGYASWQVSLASGQYIRIQITLDYSYSHWKIRPWCIPLPNSLGHVKIASCTSGFWQKSFKWNTCIIRFENKCHFFVNQASKKLRIPEPCHMTNTWGGFKALYNITLSDTAL